MKSKTPPNPCARGEKQRADSGGYETHAKRLHNQARDAHSKWLETLSPEQKRIASDLNVISPPEEDHEISGHSPHSLRDIADTPLARTEIDFASSIDRPHEIMADEFDISPDLAKRILRWHTDAVSIAIDREKSNYLQLIVGGLLSSKNPKLNSAGLAFAANLAALNGLPCQREFARQNHVSPSAVSKLVKAWQATLGLRPSAHQKSEKACATYASVGKKNHWRNRPVTAGRATDLLAKIRKPKSPDLN